VCLFAAIYGGVTLAPASSLGNVASPTRQHYSTYANNYTVSVSYSRRTHRLDINAMFS
jgi:hypothetical protein